MERILDWRPRHDPRSRNFGIAEKVAEVEKKPVLWTPGTVLDQGQEGACVGFGWTAELLAMPENFDVDADTGDKFALSIYKQAQREDDEPGENYSGTSVLAGAKVLHERGYMDSYRWAFSVEEVRDAVISEGPVVIGIPWYDSMYETDAWGLVKVGGKIVGGHCITLIGYDPAMEIFGQEGPQEVFIWRNSWGTSYGKDGNGYIKLEDLRELLADSGEACVPQGRKVISELKIIGE